MKRPGRAAGLTIVELAVVIALVAVVAGAALPALQQQQLKGRRSDAVGALTQLQWKQEQFRVHHGLYAASLSQLVGAAPISPQGLYDLRLGAAGPNGYVVTARARPGAGQERDHDCLELSLGVQEGITSHGPTARCWNR